MTNRHPHIFIWSQRVQIRCQNFPLNAPSPQNPFNRLIAAIERQHFDSIVKYVIEISSRNIFLTLRTMTFFKTGSRFGYSVLDSIYTQYKINVID